MKSYKNNILKGTVILTAAGLITRFIGFLYKIFLSNALGAETLGRYQLIMPIYSIAFTLYASGIHTAISKLVSEDKASGNGSHARAILIRGCILSVTSASILSVLLYINSSFIALRFLHDSTCANSLRILAFCFPFCGLTACINGYCYGINHTVIPALNQIFEQLSRVGAVYFIAIKLGDGSFAVTCELAVLGIVIGEIAGNLLSIFMLCMGHRGYLLKKINACRLIGHSVSIHNKDSITARLLHFAVPLSLNRLLLSLLHSFETLMIPLLLQRYGMTCSEALALYGILNGMVMPFLLFPSAITSALSSVLLPAVSAADAAKQNEKLNQTISLSVKYSLLLGLLFSAVFLCFGDVLGENIFNESLAGQYLRILAVLCPFIYISSTLTGILNGLGRTTVSFGISVFCSFLRIMLMILLIPRYSMQGCFISMLFPQLLSCGLECIFIYMKTPFTFNSYRSILVPCICLLLTGPLCRKIYDFIVKRAQLHGILPVLAICSVLCVLYAFILLSTHTIKRTELLSSDK